MRIDVISKNPSSNNYLSSIIEKQHHLNLDKILVAKSYWIDSEIASNDLTYLKDLLRDPVDEHLLGSEQNLNELEFDYLVEVSFKPGVTDNRAKSTSEAILDYFGTHALKVATGDLYFIKTEIEAAKVKELAMTSFGNPLIQRIQFYKKNEIILGIPSPNFPTVQIQSHSIETISLKKTKIELEELSHKKLWALSVDEIQQIQDHYISDCTQALRKEKGLPTDPTDVEMEIIAQSWSEHCKHKIFRSHITYTEAENVNNPIGSKKINSLFKDYIFKATTDVKEKFAIDWLVSVFTDNAGIVRFDNNVDVCFKVETHNSPSALDPYGGALTGILGVNRDILGCGIGAMPIANTNVLCFAHTNYSDEIMEKLPKKLKHPLSLLKGVHKGIEDGGNKSGIPTVNGAIHFHDNYAGKPLVYCGTVGVMPQKIQGIPTCEKRHSPGDYIVVCGGAVGADGVHGATFSSLELDDNAPATAVQIGDPFTQKRLGDFLLEARDKMLFTSITDNGAGGLSSSVGEMAEHTGGATIKLENVPLKYPGLTAYEIIISESQERMTFAVSEEKIEEFMTLARNRNVNPAIIGNFHNNGHFEIEHNGKLIASLNLDFLHNSLKPMELTAHFEGIKTDIPWHQTQTTIKKSTLHEALNSLLTHPNIKSKEKLVRQYDHEVKASTIVKPFITDLFSTPSDAAVVSTALYGGDAHSAIAISNGLAPQFSHLDTYYMTQMAMDEAIRNVVASGANPNFICLCDNFCWPDPIESVKTPDGKHKLAQLVRANQALYDMAMIYGTPFVSGKDSMKNDFLGVAPDGRNLKISIPPTLLISALAKLDTVENFMTSEFKTPGDEVFYIGPNIFERTYFSTLYPELNDLAPIEPGQNKETFKFIHHLIKNNIISSCHDVSEGGILISTLESCFAGNLGVEFDPNCIKANEREHAFFFNEFAGGFIVSVSVEKREKFLASIDGICYRRLGKVTNTGHISFADKFQFSVKNLYESWSQDEY